MTHQAVHQDRKIESEKEDVMVSRNITIDSLLGIHLRPAGAMCEEAVKYKSTVTFGYGEGKSANGKSIISILASGVKCGETINLMADGEDEKEALEAVAQAFINALKDD